MSVKLNSREGEDFNDSLSFYRPVRKKANGRSERKRDSRS